ncbi:hypothetical protein V8J88_23225 [Massilia sp. W12]|uniref:hypothetical protein n=1 Tax=Massilia sp. W12 TaxID=3126507 RepID=UPI0030CED45D
MNFATASPSYRLAILCSIALHLGLLFSWQWRKPAPAQRTAPASQLKRQDLQIVFLPPPAPHRPAQAQAIQQSNPQPRTLRQTAPPAAPTPVPRPLPPTETAAPPAAILLPPAPVNLDKPAPATPSDPFARQYDSEFAQNALRAAGKTERGLRAGDSPLARASAMGHGDRFEEAIRAAGIPREATIERISVGGQEFYRIRHGKNSYCMHLPNRPSAVNGGFSGKMEATNCPG